jgi:hypothetical protein
MTKEEFITGYMKNRGIEPEYRTEDGYKHPRWMERKAYPCTCGESYCEGWIMEYVNPPSSAAGTLCPRCLVNPLDPIFLGKPGEGHICGDCWQQDRHTSEWNQ